MTDLTEVLARAMCEERGAGGLNGIARQRYVDEQWERYDDDAKACLAALDAAGYQIVPKEPTEIMSHAGEEARYRACRGGLNGPEVMMAIGYEAMLKAAPKP
jgi:hypothetical protein